MRIFLSHSSRAKPLVREVRSHLPEHVNSWIDEKDLIAGDLVERSIREAVKGDTDFLVVFLDESAVKSTWVQKEIAWAGEQEITLGRPFILPVLIDDIEWGELGWLRERLYLQLHGFKDLDIRQLATELSSALFAWLSRDLERLRRPPELTPSLDVLGQADQLLRELAQKIRTILFPHRKSNPLRIKDLFRHLSSTEGMPVTSIDELEDILLRLRQKKLLSGVVIAGGSLYIEEEHLSWKLEEATAAKQAAADHVAAWITDGMRLFLDAGSTTIKICHHICQGVKFREWDQLTVVTNAVSVAADLLSVATELGLDDENPRLQVYVIGGRVRSNTSCIVHFEDRLPSISAIAERLGGLDIAFVGTNGVVFPDGCTTTDASEAAGKNEALRNAQRRVVLAESAKYNIRQDQVFADFAMGLEIVTAVDSNRGVVDVFAESISETASRIVLVE